MPDFVICSVPSPIPLVSTLSRFDLRCPGSTSGKALSLLCREALFSLASLIFFFLFSFVVPFPVLSSHAIRRAVYLTSACLTTCTFPFFPLVFWRTHRSNSTKNNLFRRRTKSRPLDKEWSTPTRKRRRRHRCVLRVRSIPFLFWAGIHFSSSSPSSRNTQQLTLFSLLFLNNRWTRRQC